MLSFVSLALSISLSSSLSAVCCKCALFYSPPKHMCECVYSHFYSHFYSYSFAYFNSNSFAYPAASPCAGLISIRAVIFMLLYCLWLKKGSTSGSPRLRFPSGCLSSTEMRKPNEKTFPSLIKFVYAFICQQVVKLGTRNFISHCACVRVCVPLLAPSAPSCTPVCAPSVSSGD